MHNMHRKSTYTIENHFYGLWSQLNSILCNKNQKIEGKKFCFSD